MMVNDMNETNRELLELAAKAARLDYSSQDGRVSDWRPGRENVLVPWNPLTDDGDALRLAVKLLFEIDMGRGSVAVRHSSGIKVLEAFNLDPYAATRLAIVRAAAEIGRTMK